MTEREALKPCPLCGGEAIPVTVTLQTKVVVQRICCRGCQCQVERLTRGEAVAIWNRRPTTPAPVAAGEGMVSTTVRQTSPIIADYGEHFLVAHVSKDGSLVGIDHPCDAAWADVMTAHVALRDRINERIAQQDGCPFKPAPAQSPVSEGAEITAGDIKLYNDAFDTILSDPEKYRAQVSAAGDDNPTFSQGAAYLAIARLRAALTNGGDNA